MARTFLKKIFLVSLAFSLAVTTGCGGSAVMTRPGFDQIEVGTPVETVVKEHGEPYSIKNTRDGNQEYRYIERVPVGDVTAEQNTYILVIKNGQVVSKRYNQELPPAYDEIYDDDPNDVPN